MVVPAVAGLTVLALAVAGAAMTSGRPGPADRPAVAASDATRSPAVTSAVPAPMAEAAIDCRDIVGQACRDAVRAAQLALPADADVVSAVAWSTLLCGDDLDCPRPFLRQSRPIGSVVFAFRDTSVAWVNVVAVPAGSRRFEDGREELVARVVRWFPPTY